MNDGNPALGLPIKESRGNDADRESLAPYQGARINISSLGAVGLGE